MYCSAITMRLLVGRLTPAMRAKSATPCGGQTAPDPEVPAAVHRFQCHLRKVTNVKSQRRHAFAARHRCSISAGDFVYKNRVRSIRRPYGALAAPPVRSWLAGQTWGGRSESHFLPVLAIRLRFPAGALWLCPHLPRPGPGSRQRFMVSASQAGDENPPIKSGSGAVTALLKRS